MYLHPNVPPHVNICKHSTSACTHMYAYVNTRSFMFRMFHTPLVSVSYVPLVSVSYVPLVNVSYAPLVSVSYVPPER